MVKHSPVTRVSDVAIFGVRHQEQDGYEVAMIARLQSGDRTAFEPLWTRYWPWLCRYFRAQLGSREEAEDLAGATLLAAFEQIERFRGQARGLTSADTEAYPAAPLEPTASTCSFKTYLGAIARHKLARCIRHRTTRRCSTFTELREETLPEENERGLEALTSDDEANPLQLLLQHERLDDVGYALAYVGLRSHEQFKALLFHYFCGLAHKEVAEILNLRDETVNTRLQEGRRKLTRYYQALHEEAATVC